MLPNLASIAKAKSYLPIIRVSLVYIPYKGSNIIPSSPQ